VARKLMEGSEAIAAGMIAAGCRFFSGYPMTPFTEVLEYMGKMLPGVGGTCMNAESELEAIGMAWGAAAGGVRSATGSVGQGLSLMQESMSELVYARLPVVVLNMARSQGDYFQSTRGGGHGDYRHIVLAPADVPEASRLIQLAFHLADKWRNPVTFLGDYYLAHMQETVDVAPIDFGELPDKSWALDGRSSATGHAKIISPVKPNRRNNPVFVTYGEHLMGLPAHLDAMKAGIEPMAETGFCDDAELVVVAYGTPARYVRLVVRKLREEGLKVGFVRPITLWPFPREAIQAASRQAKALAVFELNTGQMVDDVALSVRHLPVHFIGGMSFDRSAFGIAPDMTVNNVAARVRDCYAQMEKEVA